MSGVMHFERERLAKYPLELIVENTEYYRTFKLDYHHGRREVSAPRARRVEAGCAERDHQGALKTAQR